MSKTFIRVVEVWVPDRTGSMLEFGSGHYSVGPRFEALSRTMCFGRGEGLPGMAWDQARPIVLKNFVGSGFMRTQLAQAEGLTCGIALPVFAGSDLRAVVLIFCGDDQAHAGAIELWHNNATAGPDMTLSEGYYGTTSEIFEFTSRHTRFRIGNGLPGLAWQSGLPLFMPDLGKGTRFMRSDSATKVGINRGFAVPCATPGKDTYVMAFLSALATPIVRRFEVWQPGKRRTHIQRTYGFCESEGLLISAPEGPALLAGQGPIGSAFANGVPLAALLEDTTPVDASAQKAGLRSVVALPVMREGALQAVVAWYF